MVASKKVNKIAEYYCANECQKRKVNPTLLHHGKVNGSEKLFSDYSEITFNRARATLHHGNY